MALPSAELPSAPEYLFVLLGVGEHRPHVGYSHALRPAGGGYGAKRAFAKTGRVAVLAARWEHEDVLEAVQRRVDGHPERMRRRREMVEHPFGMTKARTGTNCTSLKRQRHVKELEGSDVSLMQRRVGAAVRRVLDDYEQSIFARRERAVRI